MAKEIVVTSVPRGIKLGRTGFQVVMRTAGIGDGVMSSLEQLAGYRHVHPQGSGQNPVIYSYRSVRGTTGQLNVLGRTVDAGNDFSNRSNKTAHLLSVDPAELSMLRNSSPAAVLAAIEGRLATVWQGGPEERGSPFALPGPPVQPAACRRWQAVTGDAGWGGVLAQRAMRGQPSLVIAADCSPAWCKTLLELFQEVYALLPPDNRWRTTFDTTVIGGSSSLLRGTYAGSPESAAGHAGLLVVDLSSRAVVPANMATDDFVSVARQGPKQSVARGPSRMPSLPPTLEGTAGPMLPVGQTMVGQTAAGRHHPPVNPGDFDDEPKSRLHWYILTGVLLAAIVLVGGLVAAWYWLEDKATEACKKRIEVYADADGGKPDGPKSAPTLEDWKLAFRDDKKFPTNDEFPLLMSAVATKVGKAEVESIEERSKLLAAVQGVLKRENVLGNAAMLGANVTGTQQNEVRASLESIVAGWINSRETTPKVGDVGTLQQAIDAATQVVDAAFDAQDGNVRKKLDEKAVDFLWPGRMPEGKRLAVMQRFQETLAAKEAGLSYKDASDTLENSIRDAVAESKPEEPMHTRAEKPEPTEAELASSAFTTLRSKLEAYQPKPLEKLTTGTVILASDLVAAENLKFTLSLPSCGAWKPVVDSTLSENEGQRTWTLKGLPNALDKHWGTVTLNTKKNELTFESKIDPDGPQDHLYIPLKFATEEGQNIEPVVLSSMALPQQVEPTNAQGCSLYDVLTGDPVTLTTNPVLKVAPSLLNKPNVLTMTFNGPRSEGPSDFVLETRVSDGTQESTTDLWLDIATSDRQKPQRVWLESLSTKCEAADGTVRIQLSRKNSPPWTERATRFDDATRDTKRVLKKPLDVDWNRTEFINLVEAILDDHFPDRQAAYTIVNLQPRIVKCLGLDEKKVAETDKRKLSEWEELVVDFVAHGEVETQRGKRPTLIEKPPQPGPEAKPEDQQKFKEADAKFKRSEKDVRSWDDAIESAKTRSMDQFRIEAYARDKVSQDIQDFAVVWNGIDALLSLDGRRPELKKQFRELSLVSILEASLELRWKWPNDDVLTSVPRFKIQPGKQSK